MDKTPLLLIALSLLIGIIVGDVAGEAIPLWLWLGATVALFIGAVAVGWLRSVHTPLWQSLAILVTVFALGGTLIRQQETHEIHGVPASAITWRGIIVSEPQVKGRVLRCDILITEGPWRRPVKVKAAILRDTLPSAGHGQQGLSAGRWQSLHLGDGIEAYSWMDPLSNFRRSNFDYVRWQRVHGYSCTTFIYYKNWQKARVSLRKLSLLTRARLRMLQVRHRLLERYRLLGLDDEQYAVVAAMTLGDKTALSQQVKDDYSVAGGSHVLALSGLHLSILYAILTLLFMGRRGRSLWVSQGLILLAIWMYALLVGLMPSVVRSATMLTVCSLCLIVGRQGISLNTLSLAALVMLIANPMVAWDVGFQMSFLAVAAIVICYPILKITRQQDKDSLIKEGIKRSLYWIWNMVVVSLCAQMGTAPLVAYYFERFSCYFLLTNFIVVPAATVILYGAVAFFLATPVITLQRCIAIGLTQVVGWLNAALAWIASLPGASIEGIHLTLLQVYLSYVFLGCVAAFLLRMRRLGIFWK